MTIGVLYRKGTKGAIRTLYFLKFYQTDTEIVGDTSMVGLDIIDIYENVRTEKLEEISRAVDEFNINESRPKESDLVDKLRKISE